MARPTAKKGYSIGQWREFENFICDKCAYATIFGHKMDKHLKAGIHPWGKKGQGTKAPEQKEDGPTY